MNTEASRPDKFSQRWPVAWPNRIALTGVHFCQQVGAYDLWLTPYEVWLVVQPNRNETESVPIEYTYEHAAMRFPAIEHKIIAMKAMLFSNS